MGSWMIRKGAPLGGGRSPQSDGETLRVGESRSSLDPRGSDTTCCREMQSATRWGVAGWK